MVPSSYRPLMSLREIRFRRHAVHGRQVGGRIFFYKACTWKDGPFSLGLLVDIQLVQLSKACIADGPRNKRNGHLVGNAVASEHLPLSRSAFRPWTSGKCPNYFGCSLKSISIVTPGLEVLIALVGKSMDKSTQVLDHPVLALILCCVLF